MLPLQVHFINESKLELKIWQKDCTCSFFSNEFPFILECERWLNQYLQGSSLSCDFLSLNHMTHFTQRVLKQLTYIPFGKTISYQELALTIGKPKAVRAVASACARNPFPLFYPCHRVIGSKGHLGGFSQGLEVKKLLLSFEKTLINLKFNVA